MTCLPLRHVVRYMEIVNLLRCILPIMHARKKQQQKKSKVTNHEKCFESRGCWTVSEMFTKYTDI